MSMVHNFLSTPSRNTPLFGMEKQISQVMSLRCPPSLLLSGPKGVGKATFAYHIARYLLKGQNNDFLVSSTSSLFERVAQGSHGNLKIVQREILTTGKKSRDISIDSIRDVLHFLQATSFEVGPRIVIIDSADDLNLKAGHALLKILEEPPAHSMIILICHNVGRLLPTLRSRCQHIKINPLTDQMMKEFIYHFLPQLTPLDKNFLLSFCEGCPGNLKHLAEIGGFNFYEKILNLIFQASKGDLVLVDHFIDTLQSKLASNSSDQESLLEIFTFIFLKIIRNLIEEHDTNFLTNDIQKQYLFLKKTHNNNFWLNFWFFSLDILTSIHSYSLDLRCAFVTIFYRLTSEKS